MANIHVKNLNFRYNQSSKNILNNITLDIEQGDFLVIEGANGSGKSTLLRLLKKNLNTYGKYDGEIYYDDIKINDLDDKIAVKECGYLCQNIDEQIVTDKVYHELAFPLENMGYDNDFIKKRVAEISSFFNIENLFNKNIKNLSGGQKQIVNIASIMTLDPKVILLDEPTSQLDPIGREEFIDFLDKINKTYGITIIIIEHNVSKILKYANKILVIDNGSILYFGDRDDVVKKMSIDKKYYKFLPNITRIFIDNNIDYLPLDIRDAKKYLNKNQVKNKSVKDIDYKKSKGNKTLVNINNLYFRYDKNNDDVLADINLNINENEILCIFGGNGSGKTTLAKNMSKILTPYVGEIKIDNKNIFNVKNEIFYRDYLIYLPQDIKSIFVKNSVREELIDSFGKNYMDEVKKFSYDFTNLLDRHPYDLSGGEMQFLAILKIANKNQKVIIFDEPTKALDAELKEVFEKIVIDYKKQGKIIIIITHDIEFANKIADRCLMLFNKEVVAVGDKEEFFKGNIYYTTDYYKLIH